MQIKRIFPASLVLLLYLSLSFACGKEQSKITENIQHMTVKDSITINKASLNKEDVFLWNYDQVISKLGNPISKDSFSMMEIPEFRIELLRFLPTDPSLTVKELTWRIDSITNLTIWYTQGEECWKPIHFMKWHKDAEF